MKLTLIAIILMTTWIPIFLWTQYKWGQKNYIITKTFSSILFLTIGLLGHFTGIAPKDYSIFIIIALTFGLIGDILLVYSDNLKYFIFGLSSFLVGQIVYGVLFLKHSGFLIYDIIIYSIIVLASLFINSRSDMEFGKMKAPAFFYTLAISFMYTLALSTIYKGYYSTSTTAFIVTGTTLFAASDIVLAFSLFSPKSKPILKRINLFLYYFGQMILAASIISFI